MIVFMILKVVSAPLPEPLAPLPEPLAPLVESTGQPVEAAPILSPTLSPTAAGIVRPYADDSSMRALEQINTLRVAQGLWPLKPNLTLNRVAQGQAGYLATLPSLPSGDALHRGAEGHDPAQRASDLGWPDYGGPDKVAIAEVVAAPPSINDLLGAWMIAPAESAALSSDAYREIGLASVVLSDRVIVVAVLGARPGVLPALIDPAHNLLYLTSERSAYAAAGDWIGEATRAQIIDQVTAGSVHEDAWQAWSLALLSPQTAAPFSVAYSDGKWLVTTQVDPRVDIAWLPNREATVASNSPSSAPTPAETSLQPAPTRTDAPTQPRAPGAGLTLIYDQRSLAVINTSGDRIDLRKLALVGGPITLPGSLWDTPWLDVAIYHFPAEDCVQVWAWNEPNPGPPAECRFMRAAIYVAPTERFWREGAFDVMWQNTKAAVCEAAAGRCVVKLP